MNNQEKTDWLESRRGLITASKVAALLSPLSFSTPLDVWRSIKGLDTPHDKATERFFARRSGMERVIREDYELDVGPITWEPFRVYQANEWGGATLDGWFIRDGGPPVIFEAKTTKDKPSWDDGEPSGVWSDVSMLRIPMRGGTDIIVTSPVPVPYYFQVQWQMYHAEMQEAVIVAAMGGRFDWIKSFHITRNDDVIDYMLDVASAWYQTHIIGNTPPAPSTLAEAKWIYPQATRKIIVMDDVIEEAFDNLLGAREASKMEDALKARICTYMGECEELQDRRGKTVATWKGGNGRRFLVK